MASKKRAFIQEYGADNAIVFANDDVQGYRRINIEDNRPKRDKNSTNFKKIKKSKLSELVALQTKEIQQEVSSDSGNELDDEQIEMDATDLYLQTFVDFTSKVHATTKTTLGKYTVETNAIEFMTTSCHLSPNITIPKELNESGQLVWQSVSTYKDTYFSDWKWCDSEMYRSILVTHVANHLLKTLSVKKINNLKLRANPDFECRDQGFSKCSVLYVCPLKNSAKDFVDELISVLSFYKVKKYERFSQLYGALDDYDEDAELDDFCATFRGNVEDNFAMGIKFNKYGIQLLSTLDKSDIIICSPSAMKANENIDMILSSVEIAIFDQPVDLLFQNWENVEYIINNMNLVPKSTSSNDIMRIKEHFLDGNGSRARQTIMMSSHLFPRLNSLYRESNTLNGKVKISAKQTNKLQKGISQLFVPFFTSSLQQVSEDRFIYFKKHIVNQISDNTIIIVPHYHDFVKLRNWMDIENKDFEELDEYTDISDVNRVRNMFIDGKIKFLLFSERLWYYKRSPIKGVENILFYAPPETHKGYKQFIRWPGVKKVTMLYCQYDYLALERIFGSVKIKSVIKEMKYMQFN